MHVSSCIPAPSSLATEDAVRLDRAVARLHRQYPLSGSRILVAANLVRAGRVHHTDYGWTVGSAEHEHLGYAVTSACGCEDYSVAPHHACAHRLAVWLAQQVWEGPVCL